MPLSPVIVNGDKLKVQLPLMGAQIPALAAPVPLISTILNVRVGFKGVCGVGDELPPVLRIPLIYTIPPAYTIPGIGMLQLTLMPTNQTFMTKAGRAILLLGTPFIARFQVTTPAQIPPPAVGPPTPDMVMIKIGVARFLNSQTKVKAQ